MEHFNFVMVLDKSARGLQRVALVTSAVAGAFLLIFKYY